MIEVMMAMAVLVVASAGAIVGLISASKQLRLGQNNSHGTLLAERTLQRVRLAKKQSLYDAAKASAATYGAVKVRDTLDTGVATTPNPSPWKLTNASGTPLGDLTSDSKADIAAGADLSRGAFFTVDGSGVVTRYTGATPGGATDCASALTGTTVPPGVFCREYTIISSQTITTARTAGAIGSTADAAEVMVRVMRQADVGQTNDDWWVLSEMVVE